MTNICNICGANYEYINGKWKCPACGAYKQEELSNEEATLLYNAAQKLRVQEFEDAEELYLDIIQKYPKQHEAYWGYVCSRYGIKTEEDIDGKWIPTCCFPFIESFLDDKDFKKAVEYAPVDIANWYKEQADYIERVRKTWIDMAKNEAPYEIFISYKDSDIVNGIERTRDSINALELYNHLARQGYNVFYSRESLRDKIGEKYEPYIFNALKTAKIMILYGTSVEYINSTWVKNEWHRYLKQIARGDKKENSLLVVCDGFSPNELPKVLSSKQCLDGKSKTLYVDIDNYLKQLFSKEEKEEVKPKKQVKISPLHEHIYVDEIVPSTCIARGYILHKCRCGYEYKDNYTKLAEHKYEYKSTKEPTCFEEGYKEYVCTVCGDIKKESIPPKGHTFGKWIEQIRPTCTKKGKSVRQCEECGFIEEKDISALNHDWGEAEYRSNKDGAGGYFSTCKRCGLEKPIANCFTNGRYNHKWSLLKKEGLDYLFECSVCGARTKRGLPITKVGDIVELGTFYSTPIKWKVLEIQDNKALVISEYFVDKTCDNGTYLPNDLRWASSQARQWLNKEFFDSSFSLYEKKRICKMTISNACKESMDSQDKYGERIKTSKYVQQRDTTDNIFLLSVDEVKKYKLTNDNNCLTISKDGTKQTYKFKKWKTRTTGAHRYSEDKLSVWGFVNNEDASGYEDYLRPAMWVDLSINEVIEQKIKDKEEKLKKLKEQQEQAEIIKKAEEEKTRKELEERWRLSEASKLSKTSKFGLVVSILSLILSFASFSLIEEGIAIYVIFIFMMIANAIISGMLLNVSNELLKNQSSMTIGKRDGFKIAILILGSIGVFVGLISLIGLIAQIDPGAILLDIVQEIFAWIVIFGILSVICAIFKSR